jgi:hypothetical protein
MFGYRRPPPNVVVRALFALRWWLGRVFGWDDERHDPPGASYVDRLTEADRVQSQVPPGTRDGRFRVLYVLRNEALSEIRNATVHGFLALALTHRENSYVVYLAIYVKAISRFTTLYMALIDPLRRFVVYPAIFRTVQQRVAQLWIRGVHRDTSCNAAASECHHVGLILLVNTKQRGSTGEKEECVMFRDVSPAPQAARLGGFGEHRAGSGVDRSRQRFIRFVTTNGRTGCRRFRPRRRCCREDHRGNPNGLPGLPRPAQPSAGS